MPAKITAAVQRQIEEGISVLEQGGVVAFPTDTVYGLGTRFDLTAAVARIFTIKQRPGDMALPLLLADTAQLEMVADRVPEAALLLASRFWPGALTLVLPKSSAVPDAVTAGGKTVGVRVPAHPVPTALATGLGLPIIGTSANRSGQPSPLTAGEVRAQLGTETDLLIDGGTCPGGRESTVIDITGAAPRVLREGLIPASEIELLCGRIITGERS